MKNTVLSMDVPLPSTCSILIISKGAYYELRGRIRRD